MEMLYTVYTRNREQVGLQERGDKRVAIHLAGGVVSARRNFRLADVGSQIADLLRRGFSLTATQMFFDEDMGAFTRTHPDFKRGGQVLFSAPSEIAKAVFELDSVLMRLAPAVEVPLTMIQQWIREQERHSQYLVADESHPVFALLLAEHALGTGYPLVGSRPNIPTSAPSSLPLEWAEWLSQFFALKTIQLAQKACGWSVEARLSSDVGGVEPNPAQASSFL